MSPRLELVRMKDEGKLDPPLPTMPVVPGLIVTVFVYSCFWALYALEVMVGRK